MTKLHDSTMQSMMRVDMLQAKCKHTERIWDQKFYQTSLANTFIYVACRTLVCRMSDAL